MYIILIVVFTVAFSKFCTRIVILSHTFLRYDYQWNAHFCVLNSLLFCVHYKVCCIQCDFYVFIWCIGTLPSDEPPFLGQAIFCRRLNVFFVCISDCLLFFVLQTNVTCLTPSKMGNESKLKSRTVEGSKEMIKCKK